MTDNLELVWVQNLRSFIRGQVGFRDEWRDIFVERLDATIADNARLQEALAAAEAEREWLAKLQSALAFWMPSVTEAIEIELNGRAGDDAYLLAGFDGEVPVPSWGDKAISRAEAAEAKLASLPALLAETRKKALEAGGWQPIETAPKDGTHVLLFWPNIPAGAKSLGINPKRAPGISVGWFEASECGVGFMCEGDDAVPCNQEDCTHWQPLPAPPSRLLNKEDRNG